MFYLGIKHGDYGQLLDTVTKPTRLDWTLASRKACQVSILTIVVSLAISDIDMIKSSDLKVEMDSGVISLRDTGLLKEVREPMHT
jgi:hypothetical protein